MKEKWQNIAVFSKAWRMTADKNETNDKLLVEGSF